MEPSKIIHFHILLTKVHSQGAVLQRREMAPNNFWKIRWKYEYIFVRKHETFQSDASIMSPVTHI